MQNRAESIAIRMVDGLFEADGHPVGIGVVSRDQARADTFAKKFGAEHAYTSYDDLLRNPEVTVVAIHTPNAQHAAQAIAAARAGKHVFCDKPLATSVADAERIVRECDKSGVRLGVNFPSRFMPCFIETRRIIANGEIGDVRAIACGSATGPPPVCTVEAPRSAHAASTGGPSSAPRAAPSGGG